MDDLGHPEIPDERIEFQNEISHVSDHVVFKNNWLLGLNDY